MAKYTVEDKLQAVERYLNGIRPDPDADLKAEIKAIYDEHEGRYGYRL